MHLLLPLLASLLFVTGLLCIKRATTAGVSPWTVTFLANQWGALAFSTLWALGGPSQPIHMLWQPAVIAVLYILGQAFTFSAINRGDVSVATPVFGIKVVLVAFLLMFALGKSLPSTVVVGAVLATAGIGFVQWSPREAAPSQRRRLWFTIVTAILAALSFATFDVLVQAWAPAWGVGRLLPTVYWIVGVSSLGFLPWFQHQYLWDRRVRRVLLSGTLLIALQAICIVFTLGAFGDAARVNVVYAMRGMWGVLLAYFVAKRWGGSEAALPRNVLTARFIGAGLLTVSVILVVLLLFLPVHIICLKKSYSFVQFPYFCL